MSIGVAIKVALVKRSKTQTWLAGELGVTRVWISSICNELAIPSYKMIKGIAKVLDFKTSELIALGEDQ